MNKVSAALAGAQKALIGGEILVRCKFELSNIGDHTDGKGDVYMSAKTHKLFVALTLENLVVSDGSRIISDGGGSRTMMSNSLVEDSNSLIVIGGANQDAPAAMVLRNDDGNVS